MTDQLLLPGPEKDFCQCGCGLFGTLKKQPNSQGNRCVRGCKCRPCLGRRSRAKGQRRQRRAQRTLGIDGPSLGANHEENWRGAVLAECKSGRNANVVYTKFRLSEAQAEASRAIGDNRPFVALYQPDGVPFGLIAFRDDKLEETVVALAQQLGLL